MVSIKMTNSARLWYGPVIADDAKKNIELLNSVSNAVEITWDPPEHPI